MKKTALVFIAFCYFLQSYSQTTIPSGILTFSLPPSQGPLIKANIQNDWRGFIISAGDGSPATGAYIHFFPTNTNNYADPVNGHLDLVGVGTPGAGDAVVFTNYDPFLQQYKRLLVARKDGKVVIGNELWTNNLFPGTYKLFVQDGILTEKIKVAIRSTADWADYVFADQYKLMTLPQLDSFIKVKKHLPGIPSAESVVNEGVDLGKMNAILLSKIEELTLYLIELKKQNDLLTDRISKLENKN